MPALPQASLQSLTITECGSAVGEQEFAALSMCKQLTTITIQTDSQIMPSWIRNLNALTCLNHLDLEVAPGDRSNATNVRKHMGFPTGLLQLTALTSLRLSGWTYIDAIPNAITALSSISSLKLRNCAVIKLPSALQHLHKLGHLDLSVNGLGL